MTSKWSNGKTFSFIFQNTKFQKHQFLRLLGHVRFFSLFCFVSFRAWNLPRIFYMTGELIKKHSSPREFHAIKELIRFSNNLSPCMQTQRHEIWNSWKTNGKVIKNDLYFTVHGTLFSLDLPRKCPIVDLQQNNSWKNI